MKNRIVLHYLDGRIVKGSTNDFFPDKPWFRLAENDGQDSVKVEISKLKGVFFVKDFEGSPQYQERYDIGRTGLGKKVQVRFKDGETIIGYTTGFSPGKPGFFLFPADPHCNAERIFAVTAATEEITFL